MTNYNKAVHYLGNHYILCNNIVDIDEYLYENMLCKFADDEFPDIYQWYISDCSKDDVEYLIEHFPGLLFTYSETLDLYILCVTHYGTSWNYVQQETDLKMDNYPTGTENDSNAPWNKSSLTPKRISVTVSVTMSKSVDIFVDDYDVSECSDESGYRYLDYNYKNCDLKKAVEEQITLPNKVFKDWNVDDFEVNKDY